MCASYSTRIIPLPVCGIEIFHGGKVRRQYSVLSWDGFGEMDRWVVVVVGRSNALLFF